ncbi:MAG: PDZ domain-containing protein [Pirellulales bacterium]
MIGLTTSLAAITGYEQAAGYAVPVDDTFRRVVDALKEGREVEYGLLGVGMSPGLVRAEPVPADVEGWMVESIERGSPAQRAGLVPGDVITSVAGKPIHDFDELAREVGRLPAATKTQLTVWRRGRELPVDVVLSKYPVPGRKIVTKRPSAWRGMRIDYGSAVRSSQSLIFAPPEMSEPHVVVTELAEGSLAQRAGLEVGSRISRVGGRRVETPDEFRRAVDAMDGDVQLTLIDLSGTPVTVTVPAK